MASEARRAAHALVATRAQVFPSDFPREESIARLRSAVAAPDADNGERPVVRGVVDADRVELAFRGASGRVACTFEGTWVAQGEAVRLDGAFHPVARTRRFLTSTSIVFSILIGASAWVLFTPGQDASVRILVPMVTLLAILAFPFVVVAFASHREVEELAIAKVVRKSLSPPEANS